jgi:hypothetical protein
VHDVRMNWGSIVEASSPKISIVLVSLDTFVPILKWLNKITCVLKHGTPHISEVTVSSTHKGTGSREVYSVGLYSVGLLKVLVL